MNKLLEQLIEKQDVLINEIDVRKSLRTAAAATLIGGAALGIGKMTSTPPTQSVKTIDKQSTSVQLHKEAEESEGVEASIDMKKIVQIESGGNPRAVSRVGARGLTQLMKGTWEESVKRMGKDWSWDQAFDPDKNLAVGTYYMNTEIPRLLKHYKIEDTVENRLTAYNWGIGNLRYNEWYDAPQETIDYIKKYKR